MKTIALNNLGCSKNIIDGENIVAYLNSCGYASVDDYAEAEIIIVNTCTFIQEATQEAIDVILEMAGNKTSGACKTLIVSGCFSQRYRKQVQKDFPEVDVWISVKNWRKELDSYLHTASTIPFHRTLSEPLATQYCKISDGCSHGCTYCIIPAIRGRFVSRSEESILQEAQWLSEQGVQECILVSQDTSFYGRDIGSSITHLLEVLLKKTDFHWIRMMYLHPHHINDELLKLVAAEQRLCSYFDIPLQHIADEILKKMKRPKPGTKELYHLVERIRTLVSDATIRTAFILGFPGETNTHFQQLLTFIEWARFEKVGVFPFSPEEGTKAFSMRPRPQTRTTQKRCAIVMDLQKEISREIGESHIGTEMEIIIDRISDIRDFTFQGRTRGDAPEIDGRVFLTNGNPPIGSFSKARIIDSDDYDLFGEAV